MGYPFAVGAALVRAGSLVDVNVWGPLLSRSLRNDDSRDRMPTTTNTDRKVILVLISDLSAEISLSIYIVFSDWVV